jgi:hypothetical protein
VHGQSRPPDTSRWLTPNPRSRRFWYYGCDVLLFDCANLCEIMRSFTHTESQPYGRCNVGVPNGSMAHLRYCWPESVRRRNGCSGSSAGPSSHIPPHLVYWAGLRPSRPARRSPPRAGRRGRRGGRRRRGPACPLGAAAGGVPGHRGRGGRARAPCGSFRPSL